MWINTMTILLLILLTPIALILLYFISKGIYIYGKQEVHQLKRAKKRGVRYLLFEMFKLACKIGILVFLISLTKYFIILAVGLILAKILTKPTPVYEDEYYY